MILTEIRSVIKHKKTEHDGSRVYWLAENRKWNKSPNPTLWSAHHLKRSSPVANQVMIDILVMSNGDRTAWGSKKKRAVSILKRRWSGGGYKTTDSCRNHKWYWLSAAIGKNKLYQSLMKSKNWKRKWEILPEGKLSNTSGTIRKMLFLVLCEATESHISLWLEGRTGRSGF